MESMPPKQTYITIARALHGWFTNHANNNFLQKNSQNIRNVVSFYFVEGTFVRPQCWKLILIFCKIHQCFTFKRFQKTFSVERFSRFFFCFELLVESKARNLYTNVHPFRRNFEDIEKWRIMRNEVTDSIPKKSTQWKKHLFDLYWSMFVGFQFYDRWIIHEIRSFSQFNYISI